MTGPPIDDWSDEGVHRALARLVWDLANVEADEARWRLGQLSAEQRHVVEGVIERLAGAILDAERMPPSPFSAKTAATLRRLEDEEGCNWEITLSRADAQRAASARGDPGRARGLTWTCILRWPDRMVSGEGPSAEEAMRAALREAGGAD